LQALVNILGQFASILDKNTQSSNQQRFDLLEASWLQSAWLTQPTIPGDDGCITDQRIKRGAYKTGPLSPAGFSSPLGSLSPAPCVRFAWQADIAMNAQLRFTVALNKYRGTFSGKMHAARNSGQQASAVLQIARLYKL
jgi:hypothetical protein